MALLEAVNIKKSFPGVVALDGVSLSIEPGEVHALLGENGAGKSTLIKIITGVYHPDEGDILLDGRNITIENPQKAFDLGISVIHQELSFLPQMDVASNILMGQMPLRKNRVFVDWRRAYREAEGFLRKVDDEISLKAKMEALSISQAQLVEIAKALSKRARIIFMDEPTSSLAPAEQEKLFAVIEELKAQGIAVVYISHKLEEIVRICDRVTVLRDGALIKTMDIAETDMDHMISLMVGRDLSDRYPKTATEAGKIMLEVRGLCRKGVLRDVNLKARAGEILGLTGFVGAGRTELARAIFGADSISAGEILIEGEPVRIYSSRDAIAHGVALLTEDRKKQGLILGMSVEQNIAIAALNCRARRREFSRLGFLRHRAVAQSAGEYKDKLSIKTPNLQQLVRNLSGGNQQKVIIAKWINTGARIVIFDEPTRGIDVGAKAEIYILMEQLAKEGAAVIMISSELPEILGVSDRILVMKQGTVVAELDPKTATEEEIVKYSAMEVENEYAG